MYMYMLYLYMYICIYTHPYIYIYIYTCLACALRHFAAANAAPHLQKPRAADSNASCTNNDNNNNSNNSNTKHSSMNSNSNMRLPTVVRKPLERGATRRRVNTVGVNMVLAEYHQIKEWLL